jgi:non-lysosomal glucosylceramidase
MPRDCNCAGGCGPQPDGVSRRGFLTLVGAGTAGMMLAGKSWAEWVAEQVPAGELARWKEALRRPAKPRRYRSDTHKDARMHLGGIGTGNIEIGADGQLTTWQLFNTLRDGQVPFYFCVKAGKVARLLQTEGGPDVPRIKAIEMSGDYPIANLRYLDGDLPVKLELTAFSPFAPLDTRLSSMPVACFVFKIHNPTSEKQTVSLAAMMQNPVGYDAIGEVKGNEHPNFGGNVNRLHAWDGGAALEMSALTGKPPTLDRPVRIYANLNVRALNFPFNDRPKELTVEPVDRLPSLSQRPDDLTTQTASVIWLEEAPIDLPVQVLRAAKEAVESGATLVFSGRELPLIQSYAQLSGGKPLSKANLHPDVVFEDFENGYDKWTVEGTAFGTKPANGTLPDQQPVSGFVGKGLVNSYLNGDDSTGRLISKPFAIERSYVRFLVGGGRWPATQIRLVVDGKVVRAQSGRDEERLLPALWDVREFRGKQARIEIVDEQKGGWGHINVDQIEFTDMPVSMEVMELLDELLPVRLSDVRAQTHPTAGPNILFFTGLEGLADTRTVKASSGLEFFTRPIGKGKVMLACGPIMDPAHTEMVRARQRAYTVLCSLTGAKYVEPDGVLETAPGFGTLALATSGSDATALSYVEDVKIVWGTFAGQGGFNVREMPSLPTQPGRTIYSALASTVEVPAGKTVEVPFFLAWRYPNKYNGAGVLMGNQYAKEWPDAVGIAREVVENFPAIREKTERFRRVFYDSTLPWWLLDCITANMAILRHIGVVFRIANGDVYGWEGSNGCCQPTCTHVWGYEQALSRVFPDLEKEMRRIDYMHQQREDGGINNRTEVPSPPRPTGENPFSDGHASCILKAYREALNHPDDSFLREYWPGVRKAVEYLIGRDADSHGGEPNGTLEDDQWNTYDEALHGVTTFISGYYLAALRAGEEWAKRIGDNATAARFRAVFEKGQNRLVELCWEGEYFRQRLPGYEKMPGEVGPGCMSDQLIGQWWTHQLGLGYILPKEKVQSALRSVFRYNWLPDLTNWKHSPRAFAGAKDKGLIICTWPKGGRPPHVMLYSDEVWTGIEYQAAAHMIYEGMIEEAFAIVKGARDRYDGVPKPPIPRSPWNEIECGGHYARAMSSWSLLLALSGYEYDGPAKTLRFTPRYTPHNFKSFFSGPEGWGSLRQTRRGKSQRNEIKVEEGRFAVAALHLEPPSGVKRARVALGKQTVKAEVKPTETGVTVTLLEPVTIQKGETLTVSLS